MPVSDAVAILMPILLAVDLIGLAAYGAHVEMRLLPLSAPTRISGDTDRHG